MKIKIQAQVSAMVEKTIEASCLEDGLAKARVFGLDDFLELRPGTQVWSAARKVKIIGATEPSVTR
jgi:hypothetical protein